MERRGLVISQVSVVIGVVELDPCDFGIASEHGVNSVGHDAEASVCVVADRIGEPPVVRRLAELGEPAIGMATVGEEPRFPHEFVRFADSFDAGHPARTAAYLFRGHRSFLHEVGVGLRRPPENASGERPAWFTRSA